MPDKTVNREPSATRKSVLWFATFAVMLLLLEIASSVFLLYWYRFTNSENDPFVNEIGMLSSVTLFYKTIGRIQGRRISAYEYNKETNPDPFEIDDDVLGFSAGAGEYIHTYLRRKKSSGTWQPFKTKVTINPDGDRWVGNSAELDSSSIYVFGDSYVFGSGVNDEQTFSYHLQQASPKKQVHLYAFPGYGLTQTYLRFRMLENRITSNDTIIIGYADFYDVRNVADPKRLRRMEYWHKKSKFNATPPRRTIPRAKILSDGSINVDYIEQNCQFNNGYCERESVSDEEKTNTTAHLINYIKNNTDAEVYLLHFAGDKENPVLDRIDERIEVVSALPSDFDYYIRDDVEGFDPHPGPYWHYAISRKLIAHLSE